jgi:hypothetical protein
MESLPNEIVLMTMQNLGLRSLKSLCLVSMRYRCLVQPLLFKIFKGSFYQTDIWSRLQLLAQVFLERPHLGRFIHIFDIQPGNLLDVAKLARELRSILPWTPNLYALRVPINRDILEVLCHFPLTDLKEFRGYKCFESPESNELSLFLPATLTRSLLSIHLTGCLPAGSLQLPNESGLQHIAFQESYMDYKSISKFLQACQRLKTVAYYQPVQCGSPNAEPHFSASQIVQCLHPTRLSLESLFLEFPDDTSGQLGPLGSFLCLTSLRVDQRNLSSQLILPDSLECFKIRMLEPPRSDLLGHLARASHTSLPSLRAIYFEDASEDDFAQTHHFDPENFPFAKRIHVSETFDF